MNNTLNITDLRRQQLSRRRGGGDAQPFMAQRQPYTAARGMRAACAPPHRMAIR
jgi:hypothetical protein